MFSKQSGSILNLSLLYLWQLFYEERLDQELIFIVKILTKNLWTLEICIYLSHLN